MKIRILPLLICFLTCFALVPDGKAASCYTDAEAEAERAVRIHSELMVIGLNCQHMRFSDGTNLYLEFRKFTADHGDLFAGYENRLLQYFQRQGLNGEAEVNSLRTNVANKISLDVARMKPDRFCNHYAGRILKVAGFSDHDIRQWAATSYASHPVSRPLCVR